MAKRTSLDGEDASDAFGFSLVLLTGTQVEITVKDFGISDFRVSGPPRALAMLNRVATNEAQVAETHGRLSPITPLTIPQEARAKAGIPQGATHFAFAYPLDCLRGDFDSLLTSFVSSADHDLEDERVVMFFLMGGFCYFRVEAASLRPQSPTAVQLVQINGLSLESSTSQIARGELAFDGPYLAPTAAFEALHREGRLRDVTISRLRRAGISRFAWVNPQEAPGGASLGRPLPHGAFAYQRNAEGTSLDFYFVLRRTHASEPPAPPDVDAGHATAIVGAFAEMIGAFTIAKKEAHNLETDLKSWRETPYVKWARAYGVLLPSYYLLGLLVYGFAEGWGVLDTSYYLMTTATTVGYGDFCPGSVAGRWFTSLYAPLGTITVMTALLPLVEWTLTQLDYLTAWPVHKAEEWFKSLYESRWATLRRSFRGGDFRTSLHASVRAAGSAGARRQSSKEARRRRALLGSHAPYVVELSGFGGATYEVGGHWARFHALLGPLLLGLAGVVLSMTLHGYVLHDALYWTVITMTTVGYGDLLPETTFEKLYTMVFMPLAATTLAATIERFDKMGTARQIHDTNFNIVADAMLRDEAVVHQTIHPSLSEDAFVLRVLVEESLVEEHTLNELKLRYAAMLAQGKGVARVSRANLDADGVPKSIDAELVFALLVQQGRVVDANLLDERRRQEQLARMTAPPKLTRRGSTSGMVRGHAVRGSLADHQNDGIVAVDMSVEDGGFREWYEGHWIRSLQANGVAPPPTDWVRYAQIVGKREAAASAKAEASLAASAAPTPLAGVASTEGGLAEASLSSYTRADGYSRLAEDDGDAEELSNVASTSSGAVPVDTGNGTAVPLLKTGDGRAQSPAPPSDRKNLTTGKPSSGRTRSLSPPSDHPHRTLEGPLSASGTTRSDRPSSSRGAQADDRPASGRRSPARVPVPLLAPPTGVPQLVPLAPPPRTATEEALHADPSLLDA